jgi:hypothetical protein
MLLLDFLGDAKKTPTRVMHSSRAPRRSADSYHPRCAQNVHIVLQELYPARTISSSLSFHILGQEARPKRNRGQTRFLAACRYDHLDTCITLAINCARESWRFSQTSTSPPDPDDRSFLPFPGRLVSDLTSSHNSLNAIRDTRGMRPELPPVKLEEVFASQMHELAC